MVIAHAGQPLAPHDLWSAWNADPVVAAGLLLAAWAYGQGRTRDPRRAADLRRARCFAGALVALGVALLSPLDALSHALASAHMVQHLLLVLVAAPLLALAAPSSALLRGSPPVVRRTLGRARRGLGLRRGTLRAVQHPAAVWLAHSATLWLWHAAVLYDAAVEHRALHAVEHASLLLTGLLFWRVVVGSRNTARVSPGLGVLLLFMTALQGVFLALLLTFARAPWYESYAATTAPWGLDPLADQQLAGVIMWVPAGMVYLAAALALLVAWIQDSEQVLGDRRPAARCGGTGT